MLSRVLPAGFIQPCLPSPADKPPIGSDWVHEIKHDGYRMMARRDVLKVRSCLIDDAAPQQGLNR
jgi:ATP-dependent DNA ligase